MSPSEPKERLHVSTRPRDGMYGDSQEICLDRLRYKVQRLVARTALTDAAVSVQKHEDFLADMLVFGLEAEIFAMGRKEKYFEVPASWWQHFKQRWFPQRLLRRWPVKMKRLTYVVFEKVCPHSKNPHASFFIDNPDSAAAL